MIHRLYSSTIQFIINNIQIRTAITGILYLCPGNNLNDFVVDRQYMSINDSDEFKLSNLHSIPRFAENLGME